ncbi:MAG: ribonuclease III [Clostridiales bacterium]|nr:ribonuclease III [Clostridiales bacterium]
MTLNSILSHNGETNPKLLSPLTLAFIGDSVFELMMREYYVKQANRPVKALHSLSADHVCANAQSQAAEIIIPMLTEEEQAVFRRGRNAHTSHTPKSSTEQDYHKATGLEALFGFLYLNGEAERIAELFGVITDAIEERER